LSEDVVDWVRDALLNGEKKTPAHLKEQTMAIKRRVLIPIDGSAFSLQILNVVKEYLSPDEHQLILLRVESEPHGLVAGPARMATAIPYPPSYNTAQDALRARHPIYASQEAESLMGAVHHAMLATLRHLEGFGYQVELAVRFGNPVEEIMNYICTNKIDLIAITTHGRTGVQKFLFGSVAAEIIRQVNIPVLLLRPTLQ
jgi:nucleotide-binding universal stress UspA family protein